MEDSLKGLLVTFTVIALFITCILNFVTLFPQEQGVSFSSGQDNAGYLKMQTIGNQDLQGNLEAVNNQTSSGFDQWDITQGFMGSNSMKQGTDAGIRTYSTSVFSNLKIIATELFGSGSPIVYAILIMASLATGYLIYAVIKFIRSGN